MTLLLDFWVIAETPVMAPNPNHSLRPTTNRMGIIARYQRHISPPTSPSPWRPSQTSDLANLLSSNTHLRTRLPRTDSENRHEELAKQLAKDEESVPISSSDEGASYSLAKAVVGRYVESYLPRIKEHRVVVERGVEVVGESLRQRRPYDNGSGGTWPGALGSMLSSLMHGAEVEWVMWSRITPPATALYAWWIVLAIWRQLDDGERDFLVRFTTNRDKVETWLVWAFVGLVVLFFALALVVWAVAKGIRAIPDSKSDPLQKESDTST